MKNKATYVATTIAVTAVLMLLTPSVLSWEDPNCPNLGGSVSDACAPCLSCIRDENGDWQSISINNWYPYNSCTATVWNASVVVDVQCDNTAYPVWIITQTGPGLVTANATPQPLLNATCNNGACIGTLGPNGAVVTMQVWGASPCNSFPPS